MIKTYRSCATLGVCQGGGRCDGCDAGLTAPQQLRAWPASYPFAPGVIDGLPNADAQSLRYRVQSWLVEAVFVISALVVGGAVAGYLTGCVVP